MVEQSKKQEIYEEISKHLMEDCAPSIYLETLSRDPIFREQPFVMLHKLKSAEQSLKYHPEGNVWNHTMLVLDEAAAVREESSDPLAFMWSALLHDIGKPDTTRYKKGKITSYDHDTVGERLSKEFLQAFTHDKELIEKVSLLVKYHMHMLYVLNNLKFGNVRKLVEEVDIQEIARLCRCDRMGRGGVNREEEEANYYEFLSRLKAMMSQV